MIHYKKQEHPYRIVDQFTIDEFTYMKRVHKATNEISYIFEANSTHCIRIEKEISEQIFNEIREHHFKLNLFPLAYNKTTNSVTDLGVLPEIALKIIRETYGNSMLDHLASTNEEKQ